MFRRRIDRFSPIAAALFGGIAIAQALAPYNHELLAFVAFAPLLAVSTRLKALLAVGLGLLTGFVGGVAYVGWHHDAMRLFWAYLPFLWVATILAALCLLASRLRSAPPVVWMLALASAAVTIEFATTLLPLPINIAVAEYRNYFLMPLAPVTGIWGVSFVVWLWNALIASALLGRTAGVAHLGLATLALGAAAHLLGYPVQAQDSTARYVNLIAIQDFTGDETMTLAPAPRRPVDRDEMTANAASGTRGRPAVIVWSEECLGSGFHVDSPHDETVHLARRIDASLVVGYNDDQQPKQHNCAAWLSPDGNVLGVHHKEHLYLGESETIQPGHGGEAFDTPVGRVGLEVCFDSNYDQLTRDEVGKGATLIAIPNFDPPTPRGTLHYLHSSMLPFRAAENAVPIVKCDSNGLSQVINGWGGVDAQGPLYAPATVEHIVRLGDGRGTFFTRWGDWFAWLSVAATVALLGIGGRRRTAAAEEASPQNAISLGR